MRTNTLMSPRVQEAWHEAWQDTSGVRVIVERSESLRSAVRRSLTHDI